MYFNSNFEQQMSFDDNDDDGNNDDDDDDDDEDDDFTNDPSKLTTSADNERLERYKDGGTLTMLSL